MQISRLQLSSLCCFFIALIYFTPNHSVTAKDNLLQLSEPSFFYKAKGDYYRRLGYYNTSLKFYDKALYLEPAYLECFYWKAFVYFEKGFYFNALLEIKNASKLNIKHNILYYEFNFLQSKIYFILYQQEQARDQAAFYYNQMQAILKKSQNDIQEALSLEKKHQANQHHSLSKYLGEIYFLQGLYLYNQSTKKRIEWFKQATTLNFKPALALYYQFELYKVQHAFSHAYDALKKALELNPNIVFEVQTKQLIIRQ